MAATNLAQEFDSPESTTLGNGTYPSNVLKMDARPDRPRQLSIMGLQAIIESGSMQELMGRVKKVARTSAAVLITGESGTGKELIARAVHYYSARSGRAWVDVNCAALPDHLVESELFGYEKGAFSGAEGTKQGMFELAHGGTLFLDEIGELDIRMQSKLLRVLDGASYYRLGGTRKSSVDVRIVAATNQDLEKAVAEGRFRADLYHRLNQVHLHVPALRERPEDVEALAAWFLQQNDVRLRFSADALACLRGHSWPGNVRELRNVVTTAAIFAEDCDLGIQHLPSELQQTRPSEADRLRLDGVEQEVILQALQQTGGRQDKAAELLGISRRTLIRKLKLYRSAQPATAEGSQSMVLGA